MPIEPLLGLGGTPEPSVADDQLELSERGGWLIGGFRASPAGRLLRKRPHERGRGVTRRASCNARRDRRSTPPLVSYRGRSVAMSEKPDVVVPSDQAPSYQLEIEDIVVGDGAEAVPGRVVEVHYVGVAWKTGQQFDASWDRGSTFKFGLGRGQVIAGWDQGVAGMRVGGRRRITIPPMLGYGKRGAGRAIGPDETLVFVVDLIGVR